MYVPPLHPSNNFDSYVSGEVTIHPTAVIAPGVLLQASPNSQIIIGAGVCIGMGTIIHAYEGTLEVEAGVNLGAGVLVVGRGKIGANACIGSVTTIWNHSIEQKQVVAPGSLIGDESRQVPATEVGTVNEIAGTTASVEPGSDSAQTSSEANGESESTSDNNSVPRVTEGTGTKVYGQAHLNRVLSTMLPHRQSLSRPLQDGKSPSDQT